MLAATSLMTALSAPAWSQQLKQLTAAKATFSMKQLTSSLASSSISSDCQSNGGCSNCQTDISGDFWGSSVSSGSVRATSPMGRADRE